MNAQETIKQMAGQMADRQAMVLLLQAEIRRLRQQLRAIHGQLRNANRGMEKQAHRHGNTHGLWMRERDRADRLERENAQLKARIDELEAGK